MAKATMRAAQVVAPKQVEVVQVLVPEVGPGQVRVRLQGCGVCASNIPPWEGREWFSYPMNPGALGHEGWGIVEAIGDGVCKVQTGQRVASLGQTAYAEFDIVEEGSLLPLPDMLTHVPFPGEPLGCAMNIFARSQVQAGHTVAIVGIGFLGGLLIQLCRSAGATVIAVAHRPTARKVAEQMGAQHIVAMNDHWRVIEEVKNLTEGNFCPVVIECTGKQWPLDLSAELCAQYARLVIAGYHQDGPRQVNMQLWNWRCLDVLNAHERDPQKYVDGTNAAIEAVLTGALNPDPLYTHTFPLEQIGEALTQTAERPEGFVKALVRF